MPKLIIIAGCNGAGKSTFASSVLPPNIQSFDYDKLYLENYHSLSDSELREQFAKEKTTKTFEKVINQALVSNIDFCYETNFDTYPIYWADKFKEQGFEINIIFFCLDKQNIAQHRVQVRTEFKRHFVNTETIDIKWKAGYKNVNKHFSFFDKILFIDNSKTSIPSNILQIENDEYELMSDKLPSYFERRLPEVYSNFKKSNL